MIERLFNFLFFLSLYKTLIKSRVIKKWNILFWSVSFFKDSTTHQTIEKLNCLFIILLNRKTEIGFWRFVKPTNTLLYNNKQKVQYFKVVLQIDFLEEELVVILMFYCFVKQKKETIFLFGKECWTISWVSLS